MITRKYRTLLLPQLVTLFSLVLANQYVIADECQVQKIEAESAMLCGKFMVFEDNKRRTLL
jgi:hypothetical protein